MKLMLRSLKGYRWLAVLSLVLLLVQAGCDLMLPAYTSDLIDTGIQNNGIKYAVPLQLSQADAKELGLFLNEAEAEVFAESYVLQENVWVLSDTSEEKLLQLEAVFVAPLFAGKTAKTQALLPLPEVDSLLQMAQADFEALRTEALSVRGEIETGTQALGETLKKNTAVAVTSPSIPSKWKPLKSVLITQSSNTTSLPAVE